MDGYSEARWTENPESGVREVALFDLNGNEVDREGLNLAQDVFQDWSGWYTPGRDTVNATYHIGPANIGKKIEGEYITCQIEVEFSNVQASENGDFAFYTQGATDGKWVGANFWRQLINLTTPPSDGVYTFTVTCEINEKMLSVDVFDLGFRCDYWSEGAFRYRYLKVECGSEKTDWTSGL